MKPSLARYLRKGQYFQLEEGTEESVYIVYDKAGTAPLNWLVCPHGEERDETVHLLPGRVVYVLTDEDLTRHRRCDFWNPGASLDA